MLTIEIFAGRCYLCVDLDRLIALKRAAGPPRDFETIAELEVIREQRTQDG